MFQAATRTTISSSRGPGQPVGISTVPPAGIAWVSTILGGRCPMARREHVLVASCVVDCPKRLLTWPPASACCADTLGCQGTLPAARCPLIIEDDLEEQWKFYGYTGHSLESSHDPGQRRIVVPDEAANIRFNVLVVRAGLALLEVSRFVSWSLSERGPAVPISFRTCTRLGVLSWSSGPYPTRRTRTKSAMVVQGQGSSVVYQVVCGESKLAIKNLRLRVECARDVGQTRPLLFDTYQAS